MMKETEIDFDLLELNDETNPFDELASTVEKMKLEGGGEDFGQIEQAILFLERKLQDYSTEDDDKYKVIWEAVSANNILLRKSKSETKVKVREIRNTLEALKNISYAIDNKTVADYRRFMVSNIIKKNQNASSNIPIEHLNLACNFIVQNSKEMKEVNEKEEWIIELNFETDIESNHKPLEFIHTFIEGLNTIDGIEVFLDDIQIGSIKSRIKAVIDDVKSKEELKEVLESARKFAKGKLEKEYLNSEKIKAETEKVNMEIKVLEEKLDTLKSKEAQEIKEIEAEILRCELERKKLENERLQMELFRDRKNMLKELLSEGILEQKSFEILIKGLPFLKLKNGNLTIGESIDVIDDL